MPTLVELLSGWSPPQADEASQGEVKTKSLTFSQHDQHYKPYPAFNYSIHQAGVSGRL